MKPTSFKRYIIPELEINIDLECHSVSNDIKKDGNFNFIQKKPSYSALSSDKEEETKFIEQLKHNRIAKAMKTIGSHLSDQEKDEIKRYIVDYLQDIFQSKPLLEIQKTNLSNLFKTAYGKFFFGTIIYQEKFKNVTYSLKISFNFNVYLKRVLMICMK